MGAITGEVDLFADGVSSDMTTVRFKGPGIKSRTAGTLAIASTARNKDAESFRKHSTDIRS